MLGLSVLEVAVLLGVLGGFVLLVVWLVTRTVVVAVTAAGAVPAPSREWHTVLVVRLLGFLVGVAAAVLTFRLGQHGRGPMLALAVFGLCVLLATAVAETVVRPRPAPGVRSASLAPRRVRDYLPWTTPLVGLLVLLAVAVLSFTTLTASDDDLGRARALTCSTSSFSSTHSPYPGAYYSGPLALVLLAVLLTAVVAARRVVDRPRGMAPDPGDDDSLRRNSLDMVVAATGTAVAAPLFGIALVAGGALNTLGSGAPSGTACAPAWAGPASMVLFVVAFLALCSTALLLGRLVLVPSTRRR